MPARKIPDRICVVAGRQNWTPVIGVCRARDHGHITGAKASELAASGSAEWLQETWVDRKNKEHRRALPVIRLVGKKRWKGVVSDRGSGAPMKVMQLVSS